MELLEPLPAVFAPLRGKKIFALAGTLRPETMCGQTNAWILPEGEYGAFEAAGDVVYICAARAARNMAYQDLFPEWGAPKQLLSFFGRDLIGASLRAPLTPYERIHFLPLLTISMTKGTAIVTSVPSDSPDDYAAWMDLRNEKKREYYSKQARARRPNPLNRRPNYRLAETARGDRSQSTRSQRAARLARGTGPVGTAGTQQNPGSTRGRARAVATRPPLARHSQARVEITRQK